VIEQDKLVSFLDKIHLFHGLDKAQLGGVAERFVDHTVPAGTVIFKRGDQPDGFYVVYKGKVKVSMPQADKVERQIAYLIAGDYFGEEALFDKTTRSATITALEETILLYLSPQLFDLLIQQYAPLQPNFKVAIRSRRLARSTNFKWLGKNEVIYFIARRHKIRLYLALLGPFFALFIPILLFLWASVSGATTPLALGVILLVVVLGWGTWNAIDWSNDYYIVTNQRVIWLEKVIGLHDSREEAPLGTILSVSVETDYLGRILDYGNVVVRTFVGKLEFDHVDHPVQAADMIREFWERTKAITTRSQMDVMKDTLKQKLGVPMEKRPQVELSPLVSLDEEKVSKMPLWLIAMQSLFQLRIEDAGKVIYHKHWIILLKHGWRPFGLFVLGNFFMIWRMIDLARSEEETFFRVNAAGTYSPDTFLVALPMLMLPVLFWMWYEYTDWKNDIYMVTNDEIFDIDRKPFGQEERRAAQIENILSTSYKRDGFIAYIFNYGTVSISVGGTSMAFEDVMDPANVQADINRRRMVRIAKKNEDAGKDDRERFATWLAAYHQNLNEFTQPKPASTTETTNSFAAGNPKLDDLPIADGIDDESGFGGAMSEGDSFEDFDGIAGE
jgi:CRP-like cAMP-binding protein